MRDPDTPPRLDELLSRRHQDQLSGLLSSLLGRDFSLHERSVEDATAVELDQVPVAWFRVEAQGEVRQALCRLLEMLLRYAASQRVAPGPQRAELAAGNAVLQEAHGRYRALSESLENLVTEQAGVIAAAQRHLQETAQARIAARLVMAITLEADSVLTEVAQGLKAVAELLAGQALGRALAIDDLRAGLAALEGGVRRIAELLAELKSFIAADPERPVPCDLAVVLARSIRLARAEHGEALRFHSGFAELPALHGFPVRLAQAFHGVFDEVARALAAAGDVEVSTRLHGKWVEVVVDGQARGPGANEAAGLLDPLLAFDGLGSSHPGLAAAREIIVAHGGELHLQGLGNGAIRVLVRLRRGASK